MESEEGGEYRGGLRVRTGGAEDVREREEAKEEISEGREKRGTVGREKREDIEPELKK